MARYEVPVTITIELDTSNLDDLIVTALSGEYGWFRGFEPVRENYDVVGWSVIAEDPDHPGSFGPNLVPARQLAEKVVGFLQNNGMIDPDIDAALAQIDAKEADDILQEMIYGDVVFG